MMFSLMKKFAVCAVVVAALLVFFPRASRAADANAAPFSGQSDQKTAEGGDDRVVAVLFSVGQTENSRKQFREIPNIDLLEINGEPMIMHIYKALCRSKYVQKIIVVAAPEVEKALNLKDNPRVSFFVDKGDAAENVQLGIEEIGKSDLIMFVPSDLVLVTPEGLDSLLERVLAEKDVDIVFPIVSREACEARYPEEKRTYARFKEGQYTGAHVEFLRPGLFLDHVDKVSAQKDKLYDIYYMRKNTLGIVRFLGLKLTLKYIFGTLSPRDVEDHVSSKYNVTAKALYWDDPDLSTDLSEPGDIQMIQRVLEQRESAPSETRSAGEKQTAGTDAKSGV